MHRPLTAILADDHAIMREGVKLLIGAMENVSVVAEAAEGETLLKRVRDTRADLLVLDLGMPGVSGVPFIAEIRELAPRLQIIVLTANIEPRTVRLALEFGANAYLTKDGDPEELGAAIEAMRHGETYLAQTVRFAVSEPDRRSRAPDPQEIISPVPLTQRERQILLLVAQGMTARETAERLGIREATLKTHLIHIFEKTGASRQAELVRLILEEG